MSKRYNTYKLIFIFIFFLSLDQWFKSLINNTTLTYDFFFFHIEAHYNEGLILGSFTHLDESLRIVFFSTLFGFILSTYLLIIYILPKSTLNLKKYLTLLISGICGNVIDKIRLGHAIDFIRIEFFNNKMIYFNLSDVVQVSAFILIVYSLIKFENTIWYPNNDRKNFLIYPKAQFKFALKYILAPMLLSITLGVFSYTFLSVILKKHNINSPQVLTLFILSFLILSFFFFLLIFLASMLISHKTYGPLYAFEKHLKELFEGKYNNLKLREGDEFKELEIISKKLNSKFQELSKSTDSSNTHSKN